MLGRAHSTILSCVHDSLLPNVNKAPTHSIFTSSCPLPLASHQKPSLQRAYWHKSFPIPVSRPGYSACALEAASSLPSSPGVFIQHTEEEASLRRWAACAGRPLVLELGSNRVSFCPKSSVLSIGPLFVQPELMMFCHSLQLFMKQSYTHYSIVSCEGFNLPCILKNG